MEHRLERLVMADGESVVAGFVMRAHQQTMSLFVVRFELEKLFEGPHGGLGFLPLELQRRELLRRGDELTVGLFALPLDPRRAQVREKFSAMHRHGSSQVLDRLTGSPGVLRLATAAQRSAKDLEVDVDGDRQREPVAGVGAHDARRFRCARRRQRLTQGVQREVKVRQRRCRICLGPELADELVPGDGALPIEQQQREELLGFAGAPAAVADASPACSELEWAEHEGLDAFRHRRRDRVRGRRRRGLQERREDPHVVGIELEVAEPLPQRVRQRGTQQQEVTVALRRDGTQGASRRRGVVVQGHREKRGLRLEVARADSVRRSARFAVRANRAFAIALRLGDRAASDGRADRGNGTRRRPGEGLGCP